MFGTNKFGSTTSGFGSFNSSATTASPFGGFKQTTGTSAFGAPPAFGANATTQPATGGGLFGSTNQPTGGLFGASTSTATPSFGGASGTFGGFGASTSSGRLFSNNTTGGGLFGAQNTSAFGAKPAGFGFGNTSIASTSGTGLFGGGATTGTSLFGQQNNTIGSGSLFSSNTGAFGQQQPQQTGTAHVKYNPVVGTDVVVKGGSSQNFNIKHHCITCMKEYETKSLEELRLEDYMAGRKGASNTGLFGIQQQQTENKPMFGSSAFGQPATTQSSIFGTSGTLGGTSTTGAFGQTNTFAFGNNATSTANTSGGLFGAAKPAFGATSTTGTGLFGAASTQAPTFGTNTSTFGFGNTTQNQTGGLFGAAKPATSAFGTAAPATNSFGSFGSGGGIFGNKTTSAPAFGTTTPAVPATNSFGSFGSGGGIFGNKTTSTPAFGTTTPAAPATNSFGSFGSGGGIFGNKTTSIPAFGTTTPAFGSMSGAFGTNTSTSGGGLFGGANAFGKPATAAPAFGFNNPSTGLGSNLGTGLGGTSFQNKPAGSAFGTLGGGGSLFQNPSQPNFSSGLDGSGLGGGCLFGNTSSLGGGSLGLGTLGANTSLNSNNLTGASAAGNVHEQILNLVARPYGDSPLFKDLQPDTSTTAEDVLKPTNPAAVKAVLDSTNDHLYRVTSPTAMRLKVQPNNKLTQHKKSLFDGLEESDSTLEEKLSLKPSRKRLVLRPKSQIEDSGNTEQAQQHNRSLEEPQRDTNGPQPREVPDTSYEDSQRVKKNLNFENNNNLDASSDRHGSWLNASKLNWSAEKEKSIDNEPTPRLYPNLGNLDKDAAFPTTTERRASWLTTKPLRKPLSTNPDTVENSVRELGVRAPAPDRSQDKENVDTSVPEEEHVAPRDMPPHPTGVKLTRPGYYTMPSLDQMIKYIRPDGSCVVPHLTIGRKNYGNVYYDCEIDVAGLDLDSLVHFLNKEVTIYPDDSVKPPVGQGLNRRGIVTLDRIWPRDKTEKKPITDPERLLAMDYEGKLRRVCDKHDTKFIEYRPQTGSWVFRVEHFSKYSLTDSDEEDEVPEILKRQIVNQQLQKAAAPAPPKPPAVLQPGLTGLGGLGGLSTLTPPTSGLLAGPLVPGFGHDDSLLAMQQTSINLLNGASKGFDMDTTEDNMESQSLYQDSHRAFGVKSPTSELARLEHRQSHNVQLMKASLYTDTEMDEEMSVSTGDQQVPRSGPIFTIQTRPPSVHHVEQDIISEEAVPVITEEQPMRPLIVRPHTVVLKYHRKVPPFKRTIAGRLQASYISDLSVSRARHSRVGFGPRNTLLFATSYDAVADLPNKAELCDLGKYVRGRGEDDWSESVVTRLAIGQADPASSLQEILTRHLETLLEYSAYSPATEETCPRLSVMSSPNDRLATLRRLARDARTFARKQKHAQFGVSSSYCDEVFRLCEALWGLDLENDGIPGTDEISIVTRHRRILEWFASAVADITEEELAKPQQGEKEDECDGHSSRVWTLLLGGRILEACKVARENGDLAMATLIAQSAGNPTFRSLVSRQLSLWRECGADGLIASHRLAALQLIAGQSSPREHLLNTDWLRALHATARYLCPQVPSLEQVIRTYESFFADEVEDLDLTTLEADEMGMKFPLPPYRSEYDVWLSENGRDRRVLDLRYELIRARAMNTRPKLQPAAYTPDPMDYSLCFLLGAWFGNPTLESITGMADQLEAYGLWHLAVQALAYHPDDKARCYLIRGVLSRNAPAKADTPELKSRLELIRRLGVPEDWLLLAQAHRAKYERLPAIEAEHLVGAGQWNAAHKVLLEELLPEAVLGDNLQSISPLLEKLHEASQRHEVSGWESGGQALHLYIHVCDEIRGLVSSASGQSPMSRGAMGGRLEALRPRVAQACRALGRMQSTTPRHAAARAEMGARLVQLALAAGEPTHHLAALLKALKLPPDCTAHAQHKITTDLAEQASDSCIESN